MTQDSLFSASYWTQQKAEAEQFMSSEHQEYVDAMQAKRNHNQILRERTQSKSATAATQQQRRATRSVR
jgi:hypothetical protein